MKADREAAGRQFSNNITYAKMRFIKQSLDMFEMNYEHIKIPEYFLKFRF